MNWVDALIILIIIISAVLAAAQGLFVEIFSLAGVVIGLLIASWEYWRVAPWFLQFVKSQTTANLAGFLAIFFGAVLLAGIIGRITRWAVREIGLGIVDRVLGAVFGVIRGMALVSISLMAVAAFVPDASAVAKSSLAPYFLLAARTATWVAPQDIRVKVREGVVELRGAAQGSRGASRPSAGR